jgi:hypothetical protein
MARESASFDDEQCVFAAEAGHGTLEQTRDTRDVELKGPRVFVLDVERRLELGSAPSFQVTTNRSSRITWHEFMLACCTSQFKNVVAISRH